MRTIQNFTDKMAISLSLLCAIHCLALPLLIVLLPSITALQLYGEDFHLWMLLAVIPTSLYALGVGCKAHRRYRVLILGLLGLLFLILAVVLGEAFLGERGEKILTLIGAVIMASGHYWNYRLCQHQDICGCSEPHTD
jgi:drug/metabolite transporter (DMT)-like permease